jgi:chitodextrinase
MFKIRVHIAIIWSRQAVLLSLPALLTGCLELARVSRQESNPSPSPSPSVSPSPSPSPTPTPTPTPTNIAGLAAFWKFEENSSTTTRSFVGMPSAGSMIAGPGWVNGKLGKALSFDAIDDQVKVVDSRLSGLSSITIASWIYVRSTTSRGIIVAKGSDSSQARFGFFVGTDASIRFSSGFSTVGTWSSPAGSLSLASWHHVAVSYIFGNTTITPKLYIDGVAQALTVVSTPSGAPTPDDFDIYIGSRGINNTRVFDGVIDETRIYDRVLQASDVTAIFNGRAEDPSAPGVSTGLAASAVASNQVSLTWSPATDNFKVEGYQVLRSSVPVGYSTSTTFIDGGLSGQTLYSYTVAAYDAASRFSSASTAATATTPVSLATVYPTPTGANASRYYKVRVIDASGVARPSFVNHTAARSVSTPGNPGTCLQAGRSWIRSSKNGSIQDCFMQSNDDTVVLNQSGARFDRCVVWNFENVGRISDIHFKNVSIDDEVLRLVGLTP